MRYLLMAAMLLTVGALLISAGGPNQPAAVTDPEFQVKNLTVQDIDYDDGGGLVLSWEPLPKSQKVIEYRIYRGASPDSLFQIGSIPVSAKTGVISKELLYYDKDWTEFATINSPASLDHEKNQPKNSPLYKAMPRDISVYAPLLKYYRSLGVVKKNDFYFDAKKITKVKNDPKTAKPDTTVYAGLKLYQFDGVLAKLKPGQKYYYAITTVDIRGHVHSPCPIRNGEPIDNPPPQVTPFYAVQVNDVAGKAERLQFEWEPQLFKDDIAVHSIYAVKQSDSLAFANYLSYLKKHEAWQMACSLDPAHPLPDSLAPVPNPGSAVWRAPSSYPYDSPNIATATIKDGQIVDPVNGIHFAFDPNEKYFYVFSLQDRSGFETFSTIAEPNAIAENMMPTLPNYDVIDMPNDQGEYMQVNFGRPIAYITKTSYGTGANGKHELQVNYDFSVNSHYKISNIFFKFYDHDKLLDTVNEYYLDRIINVKLPGVDTEKDSIRVEITFRTTKTKIGPDYVLSQWLYYDKEALQMAPTDVYLGKDNLTECRFYVLKRNQNAAEQRLAKRVGPLMRYYNDPIMYESNTFASIDDYDLKKNLLLISPQIDVSYDFADSTTLLTNIFPEQVKGDLLGFEKEAQTMKDSLAKVTDPAQIAMMQANIKSIEKFIAVQESNPVQQQLASFKSLRARNHFLRKVRETGIRTFQYVFAKSDGKGHFVLSGIYADKQGQKDFIPKSEWFDKSQIPLLIATLIFGLLVWMFIIRARRGDNLYVRPIAGLAEVDNAIGRATEMGRPILFVPGLTSIDDVATLAGLAILGHVARHVAIYDTRLIVPVCDFIVLPVAQEIVKSAHYEVGRPDSFNPQDIYFTASGQFPYVASVNGIMIRDKTATNFYMGTFFAEALIMTETGSTTGAVQIAGTDAITQIPFFITTCDYTLIGEELYAASAYLSHEPLILGTLKAQDYYKFLIIFFILLGTMLSTLHLTFLINAFPDK